MIQLATTDQEALRCAATLKELRPQLDEAGFAALFQALRRDGYQLAFLTRDDEVCCVAGFRIASNLYLGKYLYVDDLITKSTHRSQGCGAAMLDWLRQHARQQQCQALHLDSGVQRYGAHRFYLTQGFDITSHHFEQRL